MIEQQTRGEQLAALRKIKLDTFNHKGRKVSGAIQKATLRAIDDHQGRGDCFASQSTLADEVGCGTTAIGLAIAALIAQDLITADRPHRMAPNRHRVVWGSVFRLVGSSCQVDNLKTGNHRDPPSVARSPHSVSQSSALRVSSDPPSVSQRPAQRLQNAPTIPTSTAPTNRPDDEAEVVADLYRWGLKSAAVAVDAARRRGWSIEFIRELFIEAGGNREPQRWEPGQLANWLTGKTPPPFDEHEAAQRAEIRRDETAKREANEIRESVRRDGQSRGVAEFIIEGLTFRKLAAVGLDRFATDAEQAAAVRLDELDRERIYNRRKKKHGGTGANQHKQSDQIDRSAEKTADEVAEELGTSGRTIKRNGHRGESKKPDQIDQAFDGTADAVAEELGTSEKPSRSVNARNGSAPNATDEPRNREKPTAGRTGRQTQGEANSPKARTVFNRIPTANRGDRAFERRRAELLEGLGGV